MKSQNKLAVLCAEFYKHDIWYISGLAFLLRLPALLFADRVNYPEFYRDYYATSQLLHGHVILTGPPSILGGLHFGPAYYYLTAPFLALFGGNPAGLLFAGIVVSTFSVFAFYRVLRLWFEGRSVARWGALLAACAVYSINLSAYVSNPNFLPAAVLWFFYHLTKWVKGDRSIGNSLLLGVSFGIAAQLHPTAAAVLLLTLLTVLFAFGRLITTRAAVWFADGFLAVNLPYLVYEIQHRFVDFSRLARLGSTAIGTAGNADSGIRAIWNFILASLGIGGTGDYGFTFLQPVWLNFVAAAGFAIFLAYWLRRVHRKSEFEAAKFSRPGQVVYISWVAISILMLLSYQNFVRYYYVSVLWPAPLVAVLLAALFLKKRYNIFAAFLLLFIMISGLHLYTFYSIQKPSNWNQIKATYAKQYQNRPDILEIGAPGHYTSGY